MPRRQRPIRHGHGGETLPAPIPRVADEGQETVRQLLGRSPAPGLFVGFLEETTRWDNVGVHGMKRENALADAAWTTAATCACAGRDPHSAASRSRNRAPGVPLERRPHRRNKPGRRPSAGRACLQRHLTRVFPVVGRQGLPVSCQDGVLRHLVAVTNYPPWFKAAAVAPYQSRPGATIRSVAADLGIKNW